MFRTLTNPLARLTRATLSCACHLVDAGVATFRIDLSNQIESWTKAQTRNYPRWVAPVEFTKRVQLKCGLSILCDTRDYIQRKIKREHTWERDITAIVQAVLRPGDVFLDIGAYIGYFTVIAAKIVGPQGRVLAFEPLRDSCQKLMANVEHNGMKNVVVLNVAASDQVRPMCLTVPSQQNLGHALEVSGELGGAWCVTVPVQDCIPPQMADKVRLVKVDVEGHELNSLLGLEQVLASPKPPFVLCEMDPRNNTSADTLNALLSLMSQYRYQAYWSHSEGANDQGWHATSLFEYPVSENTNALFVPHHMRDSFTIPSTS